MRFLAYARVSTADQADHGLSLDAQEHRLREHARYRDLLIVDVVREQGSGKDLDRPQLMAALECLLDTEVDGLIVARLDRLTRSLPDFCQLVEWFHTHGKTLVVLDFELDTSTPAGELIAHMMAALAQWQRRVIAENTRLALEQRRRAGKRINQGSVWDDEHLREYIRWMRDGGGSDEPFTYQMICDNLNDMGIPTVRGGAKWRPSAIGAVLGVKRSPRRREVRLPERSRG